MHQRKQLPVALKQVRPPQVPLFATCEVKTRQKYPHIVQLGPELELHYRVTRNRRVAGSKAVRVAEFFGWVVSRDERVGAFSAARYDTEFCGSNNDFFWIMDEAGRGAVELAQLICEWWDVEIDFDAPMVEWRYSWIDRRFGNRNLLAAVAKILTREVFPSPSLMVLKAFPIDFVTLDNRDAVGTPVFQRKRAAIMRHYKHMLRAKPFPGAWGDEGWMWMSLAPGVIPPSEDRALRPSKDPDIPSAYARRLGVGA